MLIYIKNISITLWRPALCWEETVQCLQQTQDHPQVAALPSHIQQERNRARDRLELIKGVLVRGCLGVGWDPAWPMRLSSVTWQQSGNHLEGTEMLPRKWGEGVHNHTQIISRTYSPWQLDWKGSQAVFFLATCVSSETTVFMSIIIQLMLSQSVWGQTKKNLFYAEQSSSQSHEKP